MIWVQIVPSVRTVSLSDTEFGWKHCWPFDDSPRNQHLLLTCVRWSRTVVLTCRQQTGSGALVPQDVVTSMVIGNCQVMAKLHQNKFQFCCYWGIGFCHNCIIDCLSQESYLFLNRSTKIDLLGRKMGSPPLASWVWHSAKYSHTQ